MEKPLESQGFKAEPGMPVTVHCRGDRAQRIVVRTPAGTQVDCTLSPGSVIVITSGFEHVDIDALGPVGDAGLHIA